MPWLAFMIFRMLHATALNEASVQIACAALACIGGALATWAWRGRAIGADVKCAKCGHAVPPGGLTIKSESLQPCPECGADLASRNAVRPMHVKRRKLAFLASLCLIVSPPAWTIMMTGPRADTAGRWIAHWIPHAELIRNIRAGDGLATKAALIVLLESGEHEVLYGAAVASSLRDAPQLKDNSFPVLETEEWAELFREELAVYRSKQYLEQFQPANSARPQFEPAFMQLASDFREGVGTQLLPILPMSGYPDPCPLPTCALSDAADARKFGDWISRGVWELNLRTDHADQLALTLPAGGPSDLPRDIAAVYRVLIRDGNAVVGTDWLFLHAGTLRDSGPHYFGTWLQWTQRPGSAIPAQYTVDLIPEAKWRWAGAWLPNCTLRCDDTPHHGLPVRQWTLNGVPSAALPPTPW